jgi:outer membrane lipoprotein carrier protein
MKCLLLCPRAWLWLTLTWLVVAVATSGLSAQSSRGVQTGPGGGSRPAPDVLAKSLQQRYDGIHDFTADFSQTYRGGVLHTRSVEQGTVSVKKPGLMRWQYLKPEKKEFVANGKKTYLYIPQDRQVIVNDADSEEGSTSSLFLAGKGDIARDFTSSYVDSPVAGTLALRLTPRRRQPDYEYLVVAVDPATLQIRGLVTHDAQGGDSTLTFTNLKENQGISDKVFEFRIPRGVDVVNNAARN